VKFEIVTIQIRPALYWFPVWLPFSQYHAKRKVSFSSLDPGYTDGRKAEYCDNYRVILLSCSVKKINT